MALGSLTPTVGKLRILMTNDPMTNGNEVARLRIGHWDIGHWSLPPISSQLLLKLTPLLVRERRLKIGPQCAIFGGYSLLARADMNDGDAVCRFGLRLIYWVANASA